MTSHPFRSDRSPRLRQGRLLLTSALALAMSALPVSISTDAPLLGWQGAVARDGGGGNGGGNGPDGGGGQGGGAAGGHGRGGDPGAHGHGVADQARAKHGSDGRSHGGGAGGYRDATEFMDSVRSGRAFGLERRDARVAAAQERYGAALGDRGGHPGLGTDRVGPVAHQFAPEETSALIGRGWKGPAARAAGFRSHGERVRTMVELAKRLGYGARVGALQANFGTPYENDIATLQAQLTAAQARGDDAEVARLEAELAAAVANAKPGAGPDDSWATADLDVNDDGVVDQRDLEALDQAAGPDEGADEASAS